MSQRLSKMRWFWCFFAFYSGSAWNPVKAVPNPQNRPSTIESQAKFFQDFFSVQLSPYKIEFGHVCEDPNTWEQRYERKDYKNHRDMGKVRWGDKKGGYGEHYWDLNHAGHTDDHDNGDYDSDGQYNHDTYDEPSEQSPTYESNEKLTYDESERIKRADSEKARRELETQRDQQAHYNHENHEGEFRRQQKKPREKHHIVLVVNQREREPHRQRDVKQRPYEGSVRRHPSLESSVAASAPRLFFESSTGHVIDRTTGQAYVLQPVVHH
ncbi:unnamed protein product [Colias eurytheme]|nr:unnamed protein product [Colias eurytheme]